MSDFYGLTRRSTIRGNRPFRSSTKSAKNLCRLELSEIYYGLLKRAGKQFRRALKISGRKLAERRLADSRGRFGNLTRTENFSTSFEDSACRSLEQCKITQTKITVPSREQFQKLIATIRASDGRLDS